MGPIIAALLAFLVVSAVFISRQITPFGNHNLLISDMGGQYVSFFTAYRHALLQHNFQLYSFSQSLGGNAVPTLAYYLMSPFNLIILAFSAAQIPTGLTIIIMVKIMAIAVTMTCFLQRHFKTTTWSASLFGLAFSLSGFVALNYFTVMWLDALIWLPLVLMGLDHLMRTGHPGQFFGWLWVSIVTDYYLGYMTCLFVVYYFIYQWFITRDQTLSFTQELRQRGHLIGKALLTAILSAISSLFILLPAGLGMLQTAKSAQKLSNYLPTLQFKASILSQLGLGATNFSTRLDHAPTIFSTTLVSLLVLVYFVHPAINRHHRWHTAGFLVALLLSMQIQTLNTVWHLFQKPAGFPYRQSFFVSFALIMVAFAAWQARPKVIATRWQLGLPLSLSLALGLGWLTNHGTINAISLKVGLISIAYVICSAMVLFLTRKTTQIVLLTGLVTTELGGNFWLNLQHSPFGNQTAYAQAYRTEYRQMAAVNDPDGQLYRVENENTLINSAYAYSSHYRNYNDPMLFNFHDLSYYNSTFNNQTRLMLKSLGLYSKNVRRISSSGTNAVSAMLLGLKSTVKLNANGQATTTNLASSVGMGFTVPTSFTALKLLPNSALANQESLLQTLRPSTTPYFANATKVNDHVTYEASAKQYHYLHTVTLKVNATGQLYYNDTTANTKFSTMRVNGKITAPVVNADGHLILRQLGHFKRGTTVKLTFKSTQAQLGTHVHLASLDQAKFKQVYQALQKQAFVPTYHASGLMTTVTGTLNNTTNRHWLYVAIPADAGWVANVNGHTVKTKTVLGGMLAIPVTSGHNQITLTYHVPGLTLGSGLSILSLLSFVGWRRWRRRQA